MTMPVRRVFSLTVLMAAALAFAPPESFGQTTYYWDSNNGTAGFTGVTAGTWAAPTTGTTTNGWSTSAAGTTVVNGNSVTTATNDNVNFGTATLGFGGAKLINVSGTVDVNSITWGLGLGGSTVQLVGGTLNFGSTGALTKLNTNSTQYVSSAITGADTALIINGVNSQLILDSVLTGNRTLDIQTGARFDFAINQTSSGNMTFDVDGALRVRTGQAGPANGQVVTELYLGELTGAGSIARGGTAGGNATLRIGDRGTDSTFSGQILGSEFSVNKVGTGILTMSGVGNTYAGTTSVSAGTLRLNGTHTGGGLYTVASGATLGGDGSTASALSVSGIIAPGNSSIGSLDTGTVTWNGAASAGAPTDWVFALGAGDTADLLNITGNFTGNTGGGSVFRFDFAGSTDQGTFDLVTWSGSTTFVTPNTEFTYANLGGGNTGSFQFGGVDNKTLQFVAVPEPATIAILGAGVAFLGFRLARRRKA